MRFLLLCFVVMLLTGCTIGSQTLKQLETGKAVGHFNGEPWDVAWKREINGDITFDINLPVTAVPTGLPWLDIALGVLTTATAAYGANRHGAAKRERADSDEGWSKLEDAQKEIARLNRLLPPPI